MNTCVSAAAGERIKHILPSKVGSKSGHGPTKENIIHKHQSTFPLRAPQSCMEKYMLFGYNHHEARISYILFFFCLIFFGEISTPSSRRTRTEWYNYKYKVISRMPWFFVSLSNPFFSHNTNTYTVCNGYLKNMGHSSFAHDEKYIRQLGVAGG